ncbi:LamG domain-containing protein [Flavivirga spongiicola]|uniref:LamG domain-containing protein n=1 Tax=Flavivirga spongiicola TaxID=421621 RepID=A0ABU7XRQ2_9FLAO|nr:LamG domain-containing protein [Flavivirga sp. MEBiC05379]MDO5978251.1 LamG domain-containing protein [Flavivirga sp. MEBiC05379]
MLNLQKPDLGLVALSLNSSTELFDGKKAVSGSHLRWTFNPEMGFPKNGFTIQRYHIKVTSNRLDSTHLTSGTTPTSLLEWEIKINLPKNKREALSRINEVLVSQAIKAKYDQVADDLLDVIERLTNSGNSEEMYNAFLDSEDIAENGLKGGLRVMDVLMAASVDPYIARMLGLYIIDTEADPLNKYLYLVQGHWKNMMFASLTTTFENYDIRQGVIPLQFQGLKVVPNLRTLGVSLNENNDLYRSHLLVKGNLNPGFLIEFEYPVEEVTIEYELGNSSGNWQLTTLGERLSYDDDSKHLRITRPSSPFQVLNFKKIPGETFRIYKITYRRRFGAIGNVHNIIILDPSFTKTLPKPIISKLVNEQMPAILNNNGEVNNKISQIKLSTLITTPKISEVLIPKESDTIKVLKDLDQLNNPVRIQFSRTTSSNSRTVLPTQLQNISSPAIYRDNISDLSLPSLLGYWPLNGHLSNIKDGINAIKLGNPKFVKSDSENQTSPYNLKLNGNQALVLESQNHLKVLGDNFTLQAKVKINSLCPNTATLIGNSKRNGFWWGIKKEPDGRYKTRLWINGNLVEGNFLIPTNHTLELSVAYDGNQVVFRYGGFHFLNFDDPVEADLGKVGIPRNDVFIGADVAISSRNLSSTFIGEMSEISIWQQVIHPSESKHLLKKGAVYLPQQQGLAQLIFYDQKTYLTYDGAEQIIINKTNPMKALSSRFSIFVWARPNDIMVEPFPTLLGNDYQNGFWLGLAKSGNQFHLRFWLNNSYFDSIGKIKENQWSHLGVSYDGSTLKLFINGKLDSSHRASLGPITQNDMAIAIGSEILPTGSTNIKYPFNGLISNIQFWREALTIDEWHQKMGSIQLIDRFLKNNNYHYGARSIDLFGRISTHGFLKKIKTNAIPVYNPPVNLHAKFKAITGEITTVEDWIKKDVNGDDVLDDNDNSIKIGYSVVTNIPYRRILEDNIIGYDFTIKRTISYEVPKKNTSNPLLPPIIMETVNRIVEQSFEIGDAAQQGSTSFFKFNIKAVPFEQLQPKTGDFVSIPLDFFYELTWGWTGIQQLFFKEVSTFNLYQSIGIQNELSSPIEVLPPARSFESKEFKIKIENNRLNFEANELEGQNCLIGPHKFKIQSHTTGDEPEFKVKYASEPLVTPKDGDILRISIPEGSNAHRSLADTIEPRIDSIPLPYMEPLSLSVGQVPALEVMEAILEDDLKSSSDPLIVERKRLINEEKIDWFPLSKVYKITISNFQRPNTYVQPEPKDYLPSALVFYDKSKPQNKWRSFYVLWHRWTSNRKLVLYTTPGEKDEPQPEIIISATHPLRFYIGRRFNYEGELNALPQFINGKTTEQYHLALTSADVDDVKSDLSRSTVMVAVNRKRPGEAPRPIVTVGAKADYYGKSKITVDWSDPPPSETLFYKVFRATDSDIYTRDLEQRRTRQGFYKNMEPQVIFNDDVDFTDWLQTQEVSLAELFPTVVDSADWQSVTPIWRKWADRFYPSLIEVEDSKEITTLAKRMGNEKAFKLLTGKPIREKKYIDEVNGIVNNRYFYRLKTMNEALSESTIWGPLSEAAITIAVKPPRKPVFTKVEAGDRQVTLQWSLNREPDFKEYVLYRAESKKELEDLRWWSNELDPRIVDRIPDPRIKTFNNKIHIPEEFPVARILGVYRLDEFDKEASPIENQHQALNYYTGSSAPQTTANLRKIANGISVAVVYEGDNDEIRHLVQQHELIPFTNSGLAGLQDYYYRILGVNYFDVKSVGSEIKKSSALEIVPPKVPKIVIERGNNTFNIDVIILTVAEGESSNLEIFIQKRTEGNPKWKTLIHWRRFIIGDQFEDKVDKDNSIIYLVNVRSNNKLKSEQDVYIYSNPLEIL